MRTNALWTCVDARRVTAAHATLVGSPMNRDGKILVSGGVPETQAQPPCLLRYSPQLWAKELPTMFAHDPETNTLSLQPGRHPPWIRKTAEHDRAPTRESTKTWLYCTLGSPGRSFSVGAVCRGLRARSLPEVVTAKAGGAPTGISAHGLSYPSAIGPRNSTCGPTDHRRKRRPQAEAARRNRNPSPKTSMSLQRASW